MLQSTHYELKLVEGSDIVNPLVIDRPNYEVIDGVMYENESKSIGSATELKSGTIHALTRSKGNQRFFCFTATSNYEAGDTFTVDSVPVTALLPNGTALPDGAYVINGTVFCSLIGTLLTVYTGGAAIADDSLRLGGELPEYYAKASDLTSVSNTASSAQTMAVNNSNAIIDINTNLAHALPNREADITISGATYTTFGAQLEQLSRVMDFSKITVFSTLKIEDYVLSNARISMSGGTPSGIHYGSISVSGTSLTPVGCYVTSGYACDFIRATMGTSTSFTSLKASSVGGLDLKFWY